MERKFWPGLYPFPYWEEEKNSFLSDDIEHWTPKPFQNSRLKSSHNLQSPWPSRGLTRSCRCLLFPLLCFPLSVKVNLSTLLIIRTWEGTHLPSAVQDLLGRICSTGRLASMSWYSTRCSPFFPGHNHGPPRQPIPGWSVFPYNSLPHWLPLQAPKGEASFLLSELTLFCTA